MKAAKEKIFLLVFVVLTMFTCAPSFASATALEISKTRAESKLNLAGNRVGQSPFYSVKHDVNYDRFEGIALESSVAPIRGLLGPDGRPLSLSPDDAFRHVLGPDGKPLANPNTLSGHGGYYPPNGSTTVPDGTTVILPVKHGDSVWDDIAQKIDQGIVPSPDEIPDVRIYKPGDQIPNYTLVPENTAGFDDITVVGNPTKVTRPYNLSALLSEGQGEVWWSACCEIWDDYVWKTILNQK